MEQRPLALSEFIGPLSLCASTMDDQYDEYKVNIFELICVRNLPMKLQEMVNVERKSKQL